MWVGSSVFAPVKSLSIKNLFGQVTWLVVTEAEAKASGWLQSAVTKANVLGLCAVSHRPTCIFAYWTSLAVTHVIFFIVECGIARFLCAMRVGLFEVRASFSAPGYLCDKFRFCRGLYWEKLRTQSPSLFEPRNSLSPQDCAHAVDSK